MNFLKSIDVFYMNFGFVIRLDITGVAVCNLQYGDGAVPSHMEDDGRVYC